MTEIGALVGESDPSGLAPTINQGLVRPQAETASAAREQSPAGSWAALHRHLRSWIEEIFSQQREALRESERLLAPLSTCETRRALVLAVSEVFDASVRPATCVYYERAGREYVPVFVRGRRSAPPLAAESPFTTALRDRPHAFARVDRTHHPLSAMLRSALETLGAAIVMPVRKRGVLAGFFFLGDKRSGDAYSSADLALLAMLGDRIAARLDRFEERTDAPVTRALPGSQIVGAPVVC